MSSSEADSQLLEHKISGNLNSKTLLVFLQGWPDSLQMWDFIQLDKTLGEFKLLRMNMPNHGKEKIAWGQDFPVLCKRIVETIDSVQNVDRKILVAHDWGCVYGYFIDREHPHYFRHIIAMDVPAYIQLTSFKLKALVYGYQLYLIVAFLLGGKKGEQMTKRFSQVSGHKPPYFEDIKSDRNFPYYYFWRTMFVRAFKLQDPKPYNPSVPITYMYGTHKPGQFHGPKWIKYLEENEGCSIHKFEAGHWFMKKFKEPVTQIIQQKARL